MRQWTKEQEKAINTQNSNLLISAAAGSGKTAVLVERIIKIITNALEPVDIDRLLVVTFTEAAAAEMRHRIQEAIFEKLEKDAENGHLRRQIALLNRAPISTIHSFCNSVIRENFYKIGIDPSYKIADSKESFILQEEAMEEIFTAEYLKENNEIFYDLIETYGDRFLDERLRELIISIYNFSQNSTDPENWLLESVKKFELEDDFLIEKTDWGKIIKNSILTKLQGALNSCENALILCELDGGPHKYIENIKADKELINGLILACQNSFNEISLAFQNIEKFSALSRKKDTEGMDESLKESVKYIRDKDIKGVVNKIKEDFFFKDTKDLKSDMLKLKPIITKLCELVTNFKEAYFKKKIENNLLDFGDLEHLCLKILKDHDISDIYKEKFYEVFTDEYQDSNMIQETILSLVSKENNRFMVGDIKQSIYKFRRAKPEIFIEKYEKYQDDGRNIKVNLSKNFRSRENIINTVNFFFEQIMSREVGGINYSNDEALYYGANYEEIDENLDTEVYVIDSKIEEELEEGGGVEELKNIELEAKLIAKKITEMGRDYKDIAILVRQRKHINTITEELTKYNIPIYSEESVEFFKNTEIMTILSILKTIDNPLQDVNFLGSLYSSIYNFTPDELIYLRKYGRNIYFYDCFKLALEDENLDNSLKSKINLLNIHLAEWRKQASLLKITELFDMIVSDTEIMRYLSAENNPELKKANLRIFKEICSSFEKGNRRSLPDFLRYIEKISMKDSKISSAKVASEMDNTVKIMTIHKSKGLEFPVVFVAALGSSFNREDERKDIILHEDYGFAAKYTDLEFRTKTETISHMALKEQIRAENLSEELRVLYVVLTRAKEKLVLTGCARYKENSMKKWSNAGISKNIKLPQAYMFNCNCYLDFLMPTLLKQSVAHNAKFSLNEISATEILNYDINTAKSDEIYIKSDEFDTKEYEKIVKNFGFLYPNIAKTKISSKILISEIKRNFVSQNKLEGGTEELSIFDKIFDLPDFMKETSEITGVERGKAMHSLLEHLDVKIHDSLEKIKELVEKLRKSNIISEKESKSINVEKIFKFVCSDIVKRMKISEEIKKEAPFVMEVPTSSVFIEEASEDSKILIHGIIDCFFKEGDGYVLIDYKTDYVDKNNIDELINRYKIQIDIYKKAIEASYGIKIKECILYLFYIDDYIVVE